MPFAERTTGSTASAVTARAKAAISSAWNWLAARICAPAAAIRMKRAVMYLPRPPTPLGTRSTVRRWRHRMITRGTRNAAGRSEERRVGKERRRRERAAAQNSKHAAGGGVDGEV